MIAERPQYVVYSDLDGCLLDPERYDFEAARPALEILKRRGIPLVLCSSKTQAEVEFHRELLGLATPFIVENGGCILIPEQYFPFPHAFSRTAGPYRVVEFGVSYARLTESLPEIRRVTRFRLRGFAEMTPGEISSVTGLDARAARRAKTRQYDEPFMADLSAAEEEQLRAEAERRGLTLTRGGRFYHLTGRNTKGLAVDFLTRLYRLQWRALVTVGIGDGPNDLSMLEHVDLPVVIPQELSGMDPALEGRNWMTAPAQGPAGWRAVLEAVVAGDRAASSVQ